MSSNFKEALRSLSELLIEKNQNLFQCNIFVFKTLKNFQHKAFFTKNVKQNQLCLKSQQCVTADYRMRAYDKVQCSAKVRY